MSEGGAELPGSLQCSSTKAAYIAIRCLSPLLQKLVSSLSEPPCCRRLSSGSATIKAVYFAAQCIRGPPRSHLPHASCPTEVHNFSSQPCNSCLALQGMRSS